MDIKKAEKLLGAYSRALKTPEGETILQDLLEFTGMAPSQEMLKKQRLTHMAGAEMSHAECAYRNGQQDLVKYIEAMIATD